MYLSKPNQSVYLSRKQVLLGVGVSAITKPEILTATRQWVEQRRSSAASGSARQMLDAHYVCFLNVHSVMTAYFHAGLRGILNDADIAAADGMPLAWALRSFGVRSQPRVYGPDTMLLLCEQAARSGHRIFLYGGRPETLPALCGTLVGRFPGLHVAGAIAPPFRPLTKEEEDASIQVIRDSEADIIFVGIGMPKQEQWMAKHKSELGGKVMFGVGAAFDFHSGRIRQAPPRLQNAGLEWLFRLILEPRRLWRRYILLNPLFLFLWGLQLAKVLRYPPHSKRHVFANSG